MTDIKFDGAFVKVEGNGLVCNTWDIMLDAPDRRKVAGGYRRALVHDYNDGLTLNWGPDYPGGVTINGAVVFTDRIKGHALRLECNDVMLDSPARRKNNTGYRRALVHDFSDGLTLNWASDYPGGVTINGKVNCPGDLKVGAYDIETTLASLLQRVAALEAKVQALQNP